MCCAFNMLADHPDAKGYLSSYFMLELSFRAYVSLTSVGGDYFSNTLALVFATVLASKGSRCTESLEHRKSSMSQALLSSAAAGLTRSLHPRHRLPAGRNFGHALQPAGIKATSGARTTISYANARSNEDDSPADHPSHDDYLQEDVFPEVDIHGRAATEAAILGGEVGASEDYISYFI